jgi:hypothetical protein
MGRSGDTTAPCGYLACIRAHSAQSLGASGSTAYAASEVMSADG